MEHMVQIMDYIGHHETNDDYTKIQDAYKDKVIPFDVNEDGEIGENETKTIRERYDGTGRGRYQFESHKGAGGNTAVNRTMKSETCRF